MSIWKFPKTPILGNDLLAYSTLNSQMLTFLTNAAKRLINIIISGAVGAGKSTMPNFMSRPFLLQNVLRIGRTAGVVLPRFSKCWESGTSVSSLTNSSATPGIGVVFQPAAHSQQPQTPR